MLAAAAMGRGGHLRAAAGRCVRTRRFSTNGGGPANPGGGAPTNGKATGGRAPTNGGAATGGGAATEGTAKGGAAAKGVGAPTGGVVNGGSNECSSVSELRREVFEETGRICNDYKKLSEVDTILFEEVAGVEKEMGLNYANSKKELARTTIKMVAAAGVFGFTFGAWMSPYLHDSVINDSVKEVERRARLTKVDALLTQGGSERGAAALAADGSGSGDKVSAPAALAPPAAAKGDRATVGAGGSAAAAAAAANCSAASSE